MVEGTKSVLMSKMKFPFLLKATKHSILTMSLMKMYNKTSFFSKSLSLLLIAALKVIMAQYLHMDRLAQEKLLQQQMSFKILVNRHSSLLTTRHSLLSLHKSIKSFFQKMLCIILCPTTTTTSQRHICLPQIHT